VTAAKLTAAPRSHPNPRFGLWLPADVETPGWLYRVLQPVAQLGFTALWKARVFGRHHEPTGGGVAYVANHQSFLDPVLVSFGLRRPLNFMARDSLFRSGPFRWLIESLNAFPVKRNAADTGALKEAMRRLRKNAQVLVFPEGTRTRDGRIGPFRPGVALLSQRAATWTVPVLIDGAFEAWPREKRLPRPGRIVVQYGEPVAQAEARKLGGQALANRLRDRIVQMQTDVRRRLGRPTVECQSAAETLRKGVRT